MLGMTTVQPLVFVGIAHFAVESRPQMLLTSADETVTVVAGLIVKAVVPTAVR